MRHPLFSLLAIVLSTILLSPAHAADPAPSDLIVAVKSGDLPTVTQLTMQGVDLKATDHAGNTPLHWAARSNRPAIAKLLIDHGAEVDAMNNLKATPLINATGSLAITTMLLDHHANITAQSKGGFTPLLSAAARPNNLPVIKRLIAHGADINRIGANSTPLLLAAINNDLPAVQFLIAQGANVNPNIRNSPLLRAAQYASPQLVQLLIDEGANVNPPNGETPLNNAFYGQSPAVAKILINHNANLQKKSPRGSHGTPPMVFAAYFENGDSSVAKLLIEKGVDPNTPADAGTTALDWARARGNTALQKILIEAGATDQKTPKNKIIPNRSIPTQRAARNQLIRNSVQTAIVALQRGSEGFLNNPATQKSGCVSCHHQTLPALAFSLAKQRNYKLDAPALAHQFNVQLKNWRPRTESAFNMRRPQPDAPVLLGYGLDALKAFNYPADSLTESLTQYLHNTQHADGHWMAEDNRPPIEDGEIQGTAFALRALAVYPLPEREDESVSRIQRAADWLAQAKPLTFNQSIYQILGLYWARWPRDQYAPLTQKILDLQREDGGWSQFPNIPSDSWATGQALVALAQASRIAPAHPAYKRGVDFLLRTQYDDGSWWVPTRSWPFQPHFDSDFPHGKDQWVSAGGTAWAACALLLTQPLDKNAPAPSLDWNNLDHLADQAIARAKHATEQRAADVSSTTTATVDFATDIQPLLQRSCVNCHSGRRPKGGLDLTTRVNLLKGGKSEEPLLNTPASTSHLVTYSADQIEDLEMPPLDKRDKYPALTPAQQQKLLDWINTGANWPSNIKLKPSN